MVLQGAGTAAWDTLKVKLVLVKTKFSPTQNLGFARHQCTLRMVKAQLTSPHSLQ